MHNKLYEIKNELIILDGLFEYGKQILSLLSSRQSLLRNQQDALLIFDQSTQATGLFLSFMPESTIRSDFKSVAPALISQIARALMENFFAIQYLSNKRTAEEIKLEELIRSQFIDVQRYQMVQQINPANQELPKLNEAIESRKKSIQSDPVFKKLPSVVANNCVNGFTDKTKTKKEILESFNIKPEIFWTTYQHFSQFVHSNAFAADQLSSLGNEIEETLQFFCTMTRDLLSIYCLNILSLSYGFKIEQKDVPLNIQDSLILWQDFYR